MTERDTGFHRLDADYTRGREIALTEAEGIARRQKAREIHKVSLKPKGCATND